MPSLRGAKFDDDGALVVVHELLENVLSEFTNQEIIDAINTLPAGDRATIKAGIN